MDFAEAEKSVRQFWKRERIQEKVKDSRKNGKQWEFLDGPPFVNGTPHHGHLLVSTIKDTMARYHSQKGYQMSYQIGFDCHGLPLEQEAEKTVGKVGPNDSVEQIKRFTDRCRELIGNCSEVWYDVLGQLGRQFEKDQTYFTSSPEYMKELWKAFHVLWSKDLIYLSKKVMPYSPLCQTPLSNFEANSNYKERTDLSAYVRFLRTGTREWFLCWTTTPWSLLGNQGICVNPDLIYSLVEVEGERYWVSVDTIYHVFPNKAVIEIRKCVGKELEGLEYEPIFQNLSNKSYRVYIDTYVKNDTGTGLVHLAPLFGEEDYRVMKVSPTDLPHHIVDSGVRFTMDVEGVSLKGKFVMDTSLDLVIYLKRTGHVIRSEKITHSYPYCWRTDHPLVYLACDAWFMKIQPLIPEILEHNATITWFPRYVGTERFANWIGSAPDWCISRNRVWGTPIPVWTSPSGKSICIETAEELEKLTGKTITDLHLDHIGGIEFHLDGEHYKRTFGVLDCWFESGLAPLGREIEFIAESLDQTRGWFYTLSVLSTALYHRPAFKQVIVSGLILAEDGKKMSKRLGNYTNPVDIMNGYGSDVLRLYLLGCSATKAEPFCFRDKDLVDISRKLIPYANAIRLFNDSLVVYGENIKADLLEPSRGHPLDAWIYDVFCILRNKVYEHLEKLELTPIPVLFYTFIQVLCNTYIKLSRDRLKSHVSPLDAQTSLEMLYYLLDQTNLLLVPFAPHLAEYFHRELHPDADSIHLRMISNNQRIVTQKDTEERMDCLEEVIESVRKMRISLNLPMAYPLDNLIVYSATRNVMTFREVLLKELNIKTITWRSFSELQKRYKPVRSVVGKVYKARAGEVMKQIESGNVDDLQHDTYIFDYIVESREGYLNATTDKTIMYLTDHLKEENKREAQMNLVRRQINVIRKQMELKMYDRVHIEIQRDEFWNGVDHQLWEVFQTQLGGDVILVDKVNTPHQIGTTFLTVEKR